MTHIMRIDEMFSDTSNKNTYNQRGLQGIGTYPKVNYEKKWSEDGTVYTQNIIIKLTSNELDSLNKKLYELSKKKTKYENDDHIISGDDLRRQTYLSDNLPIVYGDNFLHLTTFNILYDLFGWNKNKRILTNRNTCFVVKKDLETE